MLYRSTHIRATYNTPERVGGLSQPGKVQCRIDISVRPVSTLVTLQKVFYPLNLLQVQLILFQTIMARFGSKSRIKVVYFNALLFCFIFDKKLKLSPRPSMQSRPFFFSSFNSFPNVCELLHLDYTHSLRSSFLDQFLAFFVIGLFNVSFFSSRDFFQQLPCRFGTVALKTTSKSKITISLIPKGFPPLIFPVLVA